MGEAHGLDGPQSSNIVSWGVNPEDSFTYYGEKVSDAVELKGKIINWWFCLGNSFMHSFIQLLFCAFTQPFIHGKRNMRGKKGGKEREKNNELWNAIKNLLDMVIPGICLAVKLHWESHALMVGWVRLAGIAPVSAPCVCPGFSKMVLKRTGQPNGVVTSS